jgi:hypothetical protein
MIIDCGADDRFAMLPLGFEHFEKDLLGRSSYTRKIGCQPVAAAGVGAHRKETCRTQ